MEKNKSIPFQKERTLLKILFCGLLVTLCLVGCEHIEDGNGEDYHLATLTEADVAGTSINSLVSGESMSTKRIHKTIMTQYEDIDNDETRVHYGKFSGVRSLAAVSLTEGDCVTFSLNSTIESGNLMILLVSPSNEAVYTFMLNQPDTFTFEAAESGVYFVRIGGESFKGSIEVQRSFGSRL